MPKGFRIAARALRQLGAELITSDDVALNELIKNAFDARSPRVKVVIKAEVDIHALASIEDKLRQGQITRAVALERFSKVVSPELNAENRARLIQQADKAAAGGSKDFNQFLISQRSDQYIEVVDTGKGMSADDLSNRFLVIGTPGKFIERSQAAADSKPILGDKGIGRLSMMRLGNVASVRSTQLEVGRWNEIKFNWSEFDDPTLYLDDVEVKVEPAGKSEPGDQGTKILIRELTGNWNKDKVDGFIQRYMQRLQDPFVQARRPFPVDIELNGRRQSIGGLPDWLTKCAQFKAEIVFDPAGIDGTTQLFRRNIKWRASTSSEMRSWDLKDLTGELDVAPGVFESLGPFTANCLWFNRTSLTVSDVDRKKTEVAEELNNWCGGFAVYRDNFRVGKTGGMEDDWLEWDSGALKAKGFALNRYQTIGGISISSRKNPKLVDSANRERLIACPEQELLKRLLGDVLVRDLRMHINTVKEAETKILIAEESTTESLKVSEENLKRTIREVAEIKKLLPKEEKHRVDEINSTLLSQVEYVKTIKNSLNMARETRVELLELANIGLVVEIVIHELTRLTERTSELLAEFQDKQGGKAVVDVVDNLRIQIVATNKRIRTVDAMSPAGRQRKEHYDAVAQTKTVVGGFKTRFKRHDVSCSITVDDGPADKALNVYMVKGLIAQALENLLSNSVYWLQQGLKAGDSERNIFVEIDSKALTISVTDNGPGIDPRYALEIFKPYYSTRRKGKGLGLYIASELVSYHDGKLYLDTSADEDGRLRTFTLELPKEEGK